MYPGYCSPKRGPERPEARLHLKQNDSTTRCPLIDTQTVKPAPANSTHHRSLPQYTRYSANLEEIPQESTTSPSLRTSKAKTVLARPRSTITATDWWTRTRASGSPSSSPSVRPSSGPFRSPGHAFLISVGALIVLRNRRRRVPSRVTGSSTGLLALFDAIGPTLTSTRVGQGNARVRLVTHGNAGNDARNILSRLGTTPLCVSPTIVIYGTLRGRRIQINLSTRRTRRVARRVRRNLTRDRRRRGFEQTALATLTRTGPAPAIIVKF